MKQISLLVVGYPDSDDEERAELAWRLQQELEAVDSVVTRPEGEVPAGAKGSAVEWAQLLVTMAGTVPPLVSAIEGWLGRNRGTALAVEIDGDRLELGDADPEERHAAIEAFLRRHGGA